MKSRGYSEGQIRAMQTIMSLLGEWFDHSAVALKDNGKHFFWQVEGDDDVAELIAYRMYEEINAADSTFPELDDFGDDEPEADYLTEEWAEYEDDDEDDDE